MVLGQKGSSEKDLCAMGACPDIMVCRAVLSPAPVLPEMVSPYPWTLSISTSAGNLMHSPRDKHFFPAVCLSLQPRLCLRSTLSYTVIHLPGVLAAQNT